jgi:hemolysin III
MWSGYDRGMTSAAEEPVTTAADRVDDEPAADIPNVPLLEESIEYEQIEQREEKPTWRGWIHAGTFPLAIVAGIVLLIVADGVAATWSSAVFITSSLLLFGISATYHRFHWSTRTRMLLKRFDHANIFLLIAGTYTPLSIMALPPDKGYLLLALVWAGALLGIGFRVFWISAPRWAYVPLYVLLGWAAVLYIVDLFAASPAMMTLVIVGGLAYTAGAVVYGLKRPNPVPGVFGFHEIFHTLTVVAFLCHWTGVLLIALDPPYGG